MRFCDEACVRLAAARKKRFGQRVLVEIIYKLEYNININHEEV